MSNAQAQAVILIPSLEPDHRLPEYVAKLMENGFGHAVVIDDGSSEAYQSVFSETEAIPGVTVLHHDVNHGKGVALKTGYAWIQDHLPDCRTVITADSDGQHTVTDCLRVAEAAAGDGHALWLGSRDFSLPIIPPKSRFGNRCTSAVFKALYGTWLPDTQTGLRGFGREELDFMLEIGGERYEYEMNVLIACARAKLPMKTLTIETVYENNNEGTHFHPIRDSWRIYKLILGSFFRFMAGSLASWVVDQGVAHLLFYWLLPLMKVAAGVMSPISTTVARVVSAVCNYFINRHLVFKPKEDNGSGWKYTVLAVCCWAISTGLTWLLQSVGGPFWLMKLIVDLLLYFVNYRVQQNWVFAERSK